MEFPVQPALLTGANITNNTIATKADIGFLIVVSPRAKIQEVSEPYDILANLHLMQGKDSGLSQESGVSR